MSGEGLFNGLSILIYGGMFVCVYLAYRWEVRNGEEPK